MKITTTAWLFGLAGLSLFQGVSLAASAWIDGNSLVTSHNGETRRIELPADLQNADQFEITIRKQAPDLGGGGSGTGGGGGAGSGNPQAMTPPNPPQSTPQPQSLDSLMVKANRLFNQKKYEESMFLLDEAERIDPENARVHTMKGSLFYVMGWKDSARRHWEKSLSLNEEQPQVKSLLEKLGPAPQPETQTPGSNEETNQEETASDASP